MKTRTGRRRAARPSKRRPSAFRPAPDFYRLAVESLSEYALITMDEDLTISTWSGPAARMFGYQPSEIVGRSVSVLFTPEDAAKGIDKREFERALEKGRADDERWHVTKDGRRLWCYGLSFPLKDKDDEVRGFVKLIRDDSRRKRTDDKLRESEERLRLAAESTGLGTWDYDVASSFLNLSPRAAELFGLERGPASAGLERLYAKVAPEDRERVRSAFERCLRASTGRDADIDCRMEAADGGGWRWVRTLVRGFCDRGREEGVPPLRLIGTVVDITAQKGKDESARSARDELETRVRLRTEDLNALNKELESFAYSASHDLRAPLRKIAMYSQAILRSKESRLAPIDRGYFDRIRAATATMHKLIDDTLALAHVTRKPLELGDCDLSGMARDLAKELGERDSGRKAQFVIADGLRAQGDPGLLAIALRNLFDNAWKFTSKHPAARIEFGMRRQDGHRVFFVKDDGAGFDMSFADRIFAAFRRLHTNDEFPGTGVGLGLVERIITRHHGRVWAEAQVEKGATFYFTLQAEGD